MGAGIAQRTNVTDRRRLRRAHQLHEAGGRQRAAHQEPLHQVAALAAQELQLLEALDALGHDLQVEVVAEADDGAHDGGILGVHREVVDEGAVDLERVEREALEVVERAVAGAEVIDGQGEAEFLEGLQRALPALHVLHQHPFGELELEQRGRQVCLLDHL